MFDIKKYQQILKNIFSHFAFTMELLHYTMGATKNETFPFVMLVTIKLCQKMTHNIHNFKDGCFLT